MAHLVVVGVHPLERESVVLGRLLLEAEVDVAQILACDIVHAPQMIVLHQVPHLHALAVVRGIVAAVAVPAVLLRELHLMARTEVDGVHKGAEFHVLLHVARRPVVAVDALLHREVALNVVVPNLSVLERHVLEHRAQVSMAGTTAPIVGVEPVGVVGIRIRLRLPRAGSQTVLGGRPLHHAAVGQRADLGRILLGDHIPAIVELVDVVLAEEDVLPDVPVGRSLRASDDRELVFGVFAILSAL